MKELPYLSGTPVEVEIRYLETQKLAYTIEAVVSSMRGMIALKAFRYPDGSKKKARGVSCYDLERLKVIQPPQPLPDQQTPDRKTDR